MGCFGKIFCKNKRKHPPKDPIAKNLDEIEAILVKQQVDLERQIEQCVTTAKSYATGGEGSKRMAMRALQRKKRLERKLEEVDHTLTSLETQRDALDNAKTNAAILGSMERAGKALKRANTKLDNSKVQILMDKITEQHDVGSEISNAIRRSLISEVDEDELAKELEQLQDESIKEVTFDQNQAITKYPSIPLELDDSAFVHGEETPTDKQETTFAIIENVNKGSC